MEVLTQEDGQLAVRMARQALQAAVGRRQCNLEELPPIFREKRGVFVTLKIHHNLRGCIGIPYPVMPLGEALVEAAVSAGLDDPRFMPVTSAEIPTISLEVTVLSLPVMLTCEPQERPKEVEVGRHGLIASYHGMSGLLLPQVPEECGWNSTTFLEHTCLKAGMAKDCWKRRDVEIFTFEGQIFHE